MAVTPAGSGLRRLLREPLLHFIVLGALLFVAYNLLERHRGEVAPHEIRLSLDDLAQLEMVFQSKWQREPTEQEFNALLENRIREEVLYREALALGLDKDDTIVRRRMAQKMQFLAEDMAAAREPSADELRAWYGVHSDLFALPPRVNFRHLYFSNDRHPGQARDRAMQALALLAGEPEDSSKAAALADPFMFKDYYGDRTVQEISREFGPAFARVVLKLAPGSWQGPIKSGYGWHLVFVDGTTPGRVPGFEEVEDDVKTAWLGEQKELAKEKAYAGIRAKYTLLMPVPAGEPGAAVARAPAPDSAAAQRGAAL